MIDIIVAKRMYKVQSPVMKDLVRPDLVRGQNISASPPLKDSVLTLYLTVQEEDGK